jgi:GAF domain-containing protein
MMETQPDAEKTEFDYYTALYQAALTISSSLELDQVLQSVVTVITKAMKVKGCTLRLLDPSTGNLKLSAVCGLSGTYLAKGPVDVVNSPIDQEAMQGTRVYVPDVRVDARFHYQEAARQEGLVSVLCVPLEVRGEVIGVMRVYTNNERQFHESEMQFLSVLGSLAALAIENARLYEDLKSTYDGVMGALWGTNVEL